MNGSMEDRLICMFSARVPVGQVVSGEELARDVFKYALAVMAPGESFEIRLSLPEEMGSVRRAAAFRVGWQITPGYKHTVSPGSILQISNLDFDGPSGTWRGLFTVAIQTVVQAPERGQGVELGRELGRQQTIREIRGGVQHPQ